MESVKSRWLADTWLGTLLWRGRQQQRVQEVQQGGRSDRRCQHFDAYSQPHTRCADERAGADCFAVEAPGAGLCHRHAPGLAWSQPDTAQPQATPRAQRRQLRQRRLHQKVLITASAVAISVSAAGGAGQRPAHAQLQLTRQADAAGIVVADGGRVLLQPAPDDLTALQAMQ